MNKLLSLSSLVFFLSSLPLSASEPSKGTLIMLGSVSLWMIISSVFLCSRVKTRGTSNKPKATENS